MKFESNFNLIKFKNSISNKFGRLCGIDFGTYKIGIALTDESRIISSPFKIYIRKDIKADLNYFANLIVEQRIIGFVIGVALQENGKILNNRLFNLTKKFFQDLFDHEKILNKEIPNYFHDESFSSHITNQMLHEHKFKKGQIARQEDKIAATIILQEAMNEMKEIL